MSHAPKKVDVNITEFFGGKKIMLQTFDKMKFLRYHDNVLVMQKNLVYNLFVICLSREQPEPFTPYS